MENIENNKLISRIEEVLNHLRFSVFPANKIRFSQKELSEQIDMAQGNVSNAKKGDKRYINALIEKTNNRFGNIFNERWYLYGEGTMLNAGNEDTEEDTEAVDFQETEKAETKESLSREPEISFTTGVPYYNVDFIGGFDIVMSDQTINPEYLINFKKYNDAMCWCNVTGHSMEPEINNGDMIALKEVVGWREYLPFGEVYGIITNEHRTIKRVTASSKGDGFLRLIPTNKSEEYQPQDIPTRLIIAVYKVLGCNKRL